MDMDIDISTRYGPLRARFNPPEALHLSEFVFNLFPLEERLVGMGVCAAQTEGRTISCRAGCGACCRQFVPVSIPEAFLLYEMLAGQPEDTRHTIIARFEASKEVLRSNGFGERSIAAEDRDEKKVLSLALDYLKLDLPCPFLEEESCSIHPFRPTSCREYLVTSPADHCPIPVIRDGAEFRPNPEIKGILAAVSLTDALAQLYADLEDSTPVHFPLPAALDYAIENGEVRARKYDAKELFEAFFKIVEQLARSRIPSPERSAPRSHPE